MSISSVVLPRRSFLGRLTRGATGAVAAAFSGTGPYDFSREADTQAAWDLSWIDRINKPHRLVIDPTGSGEMAIGQLNNWMQGFVEAYGKTDADLNAVLVFRHEGVGVVLSDAMQARLGRAPAPVSQSVDRFIGRGVIVVACNVALSGTSLMLSQREAIEHADAHKQIRASVRRGVYVMPNGAFAIGRAQDAGCGYLRA